jgi:hypothetical protein
MQYWKNNMTSGGTPVAALLKLLMTAALKNAAVMRRIPKGRFREGGVFAGKR